MTEEFSPIKPCLCTYLLSFNFGRQHEPRLLTTNVIQGLPIAHHPVHFIQVGGDIRSHGRLAVWLPDPRFVFRSPAQELARLLPSTGSLKFFYVRNLQTPFLGELDSEKPVVFELLGELASSEGRSRELNTLRFIWKHLDIGVKYNDVGPLYAGSETRGFLYQAIAYRLGLGCRDTVAHVITLLHNPESDGQ